MKNNSTNSPLSLKKIQVTDAFWKSKMELVRNEVIPYQWEALNDHIEGAAPSFCMRNFSLAAKIIQNAKQKAQAIRKLLIRQI